LSFHATKVFNTFEGGAVVCRDAAAKARIDRLKNFGIADEISIPELGLNGKMNEIQCAFGLLLLRHVDAAIERRLSVAAIYCRMLADVPGISLPTQPENATVNAGYFPILVTP